MPPLQKVSACRGFHLRPSRKENGAMRTAGWIFSALLLALSSAIAQQAQGPPDAAQNNGGTHPSSRDSAARTCACSLGAQGPPDAAQNSGGTHPSSRDSAARTCACPLGDKVYIRC